MKRINDGFRPFDDSATILFRYGTRKNAGKKSPCQTVREERAWNESPEIHGQVEEIVRGCHDAGAAPPVHAGAAVVQQLHQNAKDPSAKTQARTKHNDGEDSVA